MCLPSVEIELQRANVCERVITHVDTLMHGDALKDLVKHKVVEKDLVELEGESIVEIDVLMANKPVLLADFQIRATKATKEVKDDYNKLLSDPGAFKSLPKSEVIELIEHTVNYPLTEALINMSGSDLLGDLAGEDVFHYGRLAFGRSGNYGYGFFRTIFSKDENVSVTISNFFSLQGRTVLMTHLSKKGIENEY